MSEIKKVDYCLECGGELVPDSRTGIPTCVYCKRQYRSSVESFSEELKEIVTQRQLREFIKAEELCEDLLKSQPESSEAHWQMLLAKLGVVYVNEGEKMKPTFFSCSYSDRESILSDEHYRLACHHAPDEEAKSYYEVKARELDSLLKEFFMLVRKEKNYDIFISFKKTIEATVGGETKVFDSDDYHKAREIYEHLKDKYNVFFSPVSIGEDTGIQGEKYEPRILKAIQSSQAMILVGFSESNLKAQWVENEWRRYKYQIDKGVKKKASLIYVYEKQMHLPSALRDIQMPSVDVFDAKYLSKLDGMVSFVNSQKGLKSIISGKKLNTNFEESTESLGYSSTARTVISINDDNKEVIKVESSESKDLQITNDILKHGRWKDARKRFEQIIKKAPQSSQAYWGLFKAKIKAADDSKVSELLIDAQKDADFSLVDKAIENSPSADFSWSLIDIFMKSFKLNEEWGKQIAIYDFLIKYIDERRIKNMHEIIKNFCIKNVDANKIKVSQAVFEKAKSTIFIEEVRNDSIALMTAYASALYRNNHYKEALPYFEQLAAIGNSSSAYINLLACRLKTQDLKKCVLKFEVGETDDASSKKPSELDIDEIIERIIVCDNRERALRNLDTYKVFFPVYKIKLDGADTNMTSAAKLIKAKMGVNHAEAKKFVEQKKVLKEFSSVDDAFETVSALDQIGIKADAQLISNTDAATLKQVIAAVSAAMNIDESMAKKYVADNNLYKKEYESEEQALAVVEALKEINVNAMSSIIEKDAVVLDPVKNDAYRTIRGMLLFQVSIGNKTAHPFMETVVGCYRQLGDKEIVKDLMTNVANSYIALKDFKRASIWFRELLLEDTNDAEAHWGTLKCRLKAVDDYAVSRHSKKLEKLLEYQNAINCADEKQLKYYLSVYNRELKKPQKAKGTAKSTTATAVAATSVPKKKFNLFAFIFKLIFGIIHYGVMIALPFVLIFDPALIFTYLHFGWVIAIFAVVAVFAFLDGTKILSRHKGRDYRSYGQHKIYNMAIRKGAFLLVTVIFGVAMFLTGMLTAGNRTYELKTAKDFDLLANLPGAGSAHYRLVEDVDFMGESSKGYGAIKKLSGTFDGNGHTIKNLRVTYENDSISQKLPKMSYGLVRVVMKSGEIRDLNFESCSIQVSIDTYADTHVGTFAGINGGVISGCNATDCYLLVYTEYGYDSNCFVGGIAGRLGSSVLNLDDLDIEGGKITNCSFVNRNDAGNEADDDNYGYAIIVSKDVNYGGICCDNNELLTNNVSQFNAKDDGTQVDDLFGEGEINE